MCGCCSEGNNVAVVRDLHLSYQHYSSYLAVVHQSQVASSTTDLWRRFDYVQSSWVVPYEQSWYDRSELQLVRSSRLSDSDCPSSNLKHVDMSSLYVERHSLLDVGSLARPWSSPRQTGHRRFRRVFGLVGSPAPRRAGPAAAAGLRGDRAATAVHRAATALQPGISSTDQWSWLVGCCRTWTVVDSRSLSAATAAVQKLRDFAILAARGCRAAHDDTSERLRRRRRRRRFLHRKTDDAWTRTENEILGRLLRVDLIKWVSNVRPSTKTFFDFNEIWYVYRSRRVMHDGMQYDPIQGQGQGHEPLKFGNSTILKAISSPIYNGSWQMTTDSYIRAQYLKLIRAGFFIFFYFFVTWLWNWQYVHVGVDRQSPTG